VTAKLYQKIRLLLSIKTNRSLRRTSQSIAALVFRQPILLSSLLITGLVVGIRRLEVLQPLELMSFDQMVRLQPDAGQDPRLLVVGITDADIQAQKQWPLSDKTVAELLAKLQGYHPKAIGLDMYRDVPQQPGHTALLKQLQAPNIITITKLDDGTGNEVKAPPGVPEKRIGFNEVVLDPDGVVRRNFMYASVGKDKLYSLSLRLSLSFLNNQEVIAGKYLELGKKSFVPLEADSGGYQNIDALGYQVLLNYRSPTVAKQVTLTEVLNGQLNPSWVKDKIVLIGTTAPSIKDVFFTPYNATNNKEATTPGVLVHAQMVSQILNTALDNRPLFWFWPWWGEMLWVWGWSLVGGILAWRIQRPLLLIVVTTVAVGGLFGLCFGLFTLAGWIPFVPTAMALVGTVSTTVAYKLFHNAFYDALTGLPNRALFLKRLQEAIVRIKRRDNSFLAVLFLDIDRFKVINESFGHPVGDQLLVAVTQRLNSYLRFTGLVARVGGDEFAILLEDINHISQATLVADELQKELILPFKLKGEEIFISASVGIVINQADYDYQADELLRDAHIAMYRAKALGKARYEIFATGMRTQVVNKLQLETDLRRAIERQEFLVYYQPIVSLKTGKIAGFESLVRWQHPTRGLVSPGEFIPVAEETELIIPMSQWILHESCRQMRVWQEQFPMNPPLMISVNLSLQQFSQPDLVEQIEETLKVTGLDGHTLKLEITESMAMNDVESTIAALLRLKKLNLRLSIDDFGTGYSSLSYLHRFPADTLKVDRSFVMRMDDTSEDAAIVQTIVMLSHNLGMDVVAEGVETAAQLEKLRSLQCEYGQGYFFSKPLPSEAAAALLAKEPTW
jgi:diguanylate cyclase (GGDEF)-like protein